MKMTQEKYIYELLRRAGLKQIIGDRNKKISKITDNTKDVIPNSMFVAIRGTTADGHKFIPEAIEKGAVAIVCEEIPQDLQEDITYIQVENSRIALGQIISEYYDNVARNFVTIGVTGTNGKTTTATWVYKMLSFFRKKTVLLSTVNNIIIDEILPTNHTTPPVIELHKLLNDAYEKGAEYLSMEVSSHALSQYRVEGLKFDAAIFTNLTHDHLDYHKDFKSYRDAKKILFDRYTTINSAAIINKDDRNAKYMVQNTEAKVITYAMKSPADYKAKVLEEDLYGITILLENYEYSAELTYPFIGTYNIYNVLAAIASLHSLNFDYEEILKISTLLKPPPGRMETFKLPNNAVAIVDYAHTPDALNNVLKSLRKLPDLNNIIVVVGAGGNRDQEKRPVMGKVVSLLADTIIITSDNPRNEDPKKIAKQIYEGIIPEKRQNTIIQLDREEAIKTAVMLSKPGDAILIAGKGHEQYQEIEGVKYPFSDQKIIKKLLN